MQILRFIKDWTLPVAIATGITVYLVFALVPALDGFATAADPIFQQLLPAFMFLVLFVTFCKVDYRKLRPVAWHWWIGLFQILTVGAIMALILCLHLTGDSLILAEAVLTCIICPCASAAAVVTQKLGGNLEEMTTYTFLSNFITALLIPVCFPMIDKAADIHFLKAFALILYKVFTVLVVPMILAYIASRKGCMPAHHFHKRPFLLSLGMFVADSFGHNDEEHPACRHKHCFSARHCRMLARAVSVPVWVRQGYWLSLQPDGQCRSGIGSEEHCLCYMDSLHLSVAAVVGWSGLLYSVAEYH